MEEKGLDIKGVFKVSLIDYPGKIATTIFLAKCNFRCPYCHNPELVSGHEKLPAIDPEEILAFLEKKKKWLDGVVFTGGEPTLSPALPEMIKRIKGKGFSVKLDTNGSNPEMLEKLLQENLLDYIAMDIKAEQEGYAKKTDSKIDVSLVRKSVGLIMKSGVEYEFRTTVVPGFHDEKTLLKIGEWLKGAKKYVLQQFNPANDMLDNSLQNVSPYSPAQLEKFAESLKSYFSTVEVRGV